MSRASYYPQPTQTHPDIRPAVEVDRFVRPGQPLSSSAAGHPVAICTATDPDIWVRSQRCCYGNL